MSQSLSSSVFQAANVFIFGVLLPRRMSAFPLKNAFALQLKECKPGKLPVRHFDKVAPIAKSEAPVSFVKGNASSLGCKVA